MARTRLDAEELRRYAGRDWTAPERLARRARAQQTVERKFELAVEMYKAARESCPGWPDEKTRRQDLNAHFRLRGLLDKAAHVGSQ